MKWKLYIDAFNPFNYSELFAFNLLCRNVCKQNTSAYSHSSKQWNLTVIKNATFFITTIKMYLNHTHKNMLHITHAEVVYKYYDYFLFYIIALGTHLFILYN